VTDHPVVVDDEQEDLTPLEIARAAARAEYFERRINKLLAGSPPLSQAQRDKLATILRGSS
jgi:hypothetical protein